MRFQKFNRPLLWVAVSGASFILAACGGGGGGNSSSATAPATGTANVQITDGPSDNFNHVWVTVTEIAFHTDPNLTWNSADTTWVKFPLQAPVTIDLAALNNGALNNLFQGLSLPVGSYKQIRLFFASAEDVLTTPAQSTMDSNNTALQWNDQVEYTDSTNTVQEAPLEIAYPTQGVQLIGSFDISATKQLNLAVDFDLDKIIVPFKHDSMTAFTMRPDLRYFDLDNAGAIVGKVDTTNLCASTSNTSNCAYNLIVKAELLAADGTRHYEARATSIKSDGSFALFPLPVHDGAGNALSYDVLIRGRQMDTDLITGVPVTVGTTPGSSPTQIQGSSMIPITVNTAEYEAQFSAALSPLTSGYAIFQQTLPGAGAVPYEIRWDNTDPFSGLLYNSHATNEGEALATGPIHTASYMSGSTLSFNSVTPVEGDGGFSVATNEVAYYSLSANSSLSKPTSGTTQTLTPPMPTLNAGVSSGSIAGNIAVGGNNAGYDKAQLVVSRLAHIVTAQEIDQVLVNNQGGAFTINGIPAGTASNNVAGAYYYAYVRLWKSGAHKKAAIIPISGMIDLRKTNSATAINVTLP